MYLENIIAGYLREFQWAADILDKNDEAYLGHATMVREVERAQACLDLLKTMPRLDPIEFMEGR